MTEGKDWVAIERDGNFVLEGNGEVSVGLLWPRFGTKTADRFRLSETGHQRWKSCFLVQRSPFSLHRRSVVLSVYINHEMEWNTFFQRSQELGVSEAVGMRFCRIWCEWKWGLQHGLQNKLEDDKGGCIASCPLGDLVNIHLLIPRVMGIRVRVPLSTPSADYHPPCFLSFSHLQR